MIEPFLLGALIGATLVAVAGCMAHALWRALGPMAAPTPPRVGPLPGVDLAYDDAMTRLCAQSSMPGAISYPVRRI